MLIVLVKDMDPPVVLLLHDQTPALPIADPNDDQNC